MKRRRFFKATTVASLATMAGANSLKADNIQDAKQEFYEFRVYTLQGRGALPKLDAYLSDALIPAFNRHGVKNVGVFYEMAAPEPPKVYVLIPHASAAAFGSVAGLLSEDKDYQTAALSYNEIPVEGKVYDRYDTWLLQAFSGLPKLVAPDVKEQRIFELRTYEGFSDDAVRRKVKMFNDGEIDIFNKTGLHGVFFGHMMAGPAMPALTYMLTFKNMEERDQNWKAFVDHPEWKRISKLPEYANTVSRIYRVFLEPAPYSQV